MILGKKCRGGAGAFFLTKEYSNYKILYINSFRTKFMEAIEMELTRREIEMGTGKTFPPLFKFGIPTMLGMIINAVYNLVDTYFIGSFGMVPTAAVSLVFPLTPPSQAWEHASAVVRAPRFRSAGDKQHRRASEYTSTAIVGAVVCGLALSAAAAGPAPDFDRHGRGRRYSALCRAVRDSDYYGLCVQRIQHYREQHHRL